MATGITSLAGVNDVAKEMLLLIFKIRNTLCILPLQFRVP